jgi:hypothetical protein
VSRAETSPTPLFDELRPVGRELAGDKLAKHSAHLRFESKDEVENPKGVCWSC